VDAIRGIAEGAGLSSSRRARTPRKAIVHADQVQAAAIGHEQSSKRLSS